MVSESMLVSVQVGRIRTYGISDAPSDPSNPFDRKWTTAFFKSPVSGPVRITALGAEGDQQADKRYHGGPDMALLAYSDEHYPHWRTQTGLLDMGPGGFGENLTLTHYREQTVSIGDTFQIGSEVVVQVSQPRGPCSKIEKRWRCPGLLKLVAETGQTGWYLRVLTPGTVQAGDPVTRLSHPYPDLTIARANLAKSHRKTRPDLALPFLDCPLAAPDFKNDLRPR